jgi:NADH-quinone oxidoreductase subunit H
MIPAASEGLYHIVARSWVNAGWPLIVWQWLWLLIICVAVIVFILLSVLFLVWLERKVSGDIQSRVGPVRVGPFGLIQTMADALKLLTKEDIIPTRADRWLFVLAPFLVFVPALVVYVVLPFGHNLTPADLNIALLFVVAAGSVPVIGLLMAGWGSNNKWSLLGALRSAAQIISYEVPLVLSLLAVVLWAGTLSTVGIVKAQAGLWYIAYPPLTLAFLIYLIASVAEVNRTPFDIPEAESELVAGFHTEYSGMRFAFFFLAEYAHTFFVAGLGATLFLGGWEGPLLPGWLWFLAKSYALVIIIMWLRWTVPRVRVDQLMNFSWKVLLPISLLDLMIVATWLAVRVS